MNDANLPNPFHCARRVPGVSVLLKPEDVMNASETTSRAQAERLLEENGTTIAAQMLAAGLEAAVTILREEGGGA